MEAGEHTSECHYVKCLSIEAGRLSNKLTVDESRRKSGKPVLSSQPHSEHTVDHVRERHGYQSRAAHL